MVKFDFHVSKQTRIKYEFDASLFSITGNLIIADAHQARVLSDKINRKRRSEGNYDQLVTAGQINACGLLHEIFHFMIRHYEDSTNPGVFGKAIDHLKKEINENGLDELLNTFIDEFPPLKVYSGEISSKDFINGKTENKPNVEILLEEIILLHIENLNPATSNLKELFADDNLKRTNNYKKVIRTTEEFFENELPVVKGGLSLFKMLRKPIEQNPDDILKQLDFIRDEWGFIIDEKFRRRLLSGSDLIKEDYKLFVKHGGGEKGTPPVPDYDKELLRLREIQKKKDSGQDLSEQEKLYYIEYEKFTEDTGWIPEIVMIAKNVFVWMHQLSEKYQREIKKLDQIPDEELDRLARWNYNALWLIGIWERSPASKKIKQYTGNPEAAASAYSLYDYVIANELGGESAFQNLKDRAWLRGIRLASDMVPNHTGIYSKWVTEKPDYFIQRNDPPYPGYTFNGPNLSDDDRVEVRIEDKYYDRTDAAVVFQRRDKYTGDVKYIYHGNDGTNMPWNDTAQLNLLNPEVRESLIQTIMHVARKTPIIRFDAAMTLAKKHYQRLWYPQPGAGGAIPSRSDFALTTEQFNSAMPQEFWREVVDRINESMPNVLLMAEAFWLMESYFVRTLGMHRVYNSAFMHMMMKEENKKYRDLIIKTLEFNPEILKRYVNFMSNPDEETAVNQFGKGDKYFGVAVMLVTMPGLPMFGHGQVEGFSEKYGMEYKRAYYTESPDEHLIWRHQKEIFPLMKMRHIFSQVENFEFYNFVTVNGIVDQNVFAFSNRFGNEVAVVLYNNSYSTTEGIINYSLIRAIAGNAGSLKQSEKIGSVLWMKPDSKYFYSYKDHRTGLEYLLSGIQVYNEGLKIHLFGYQYRICFQFKELYDESGKLKELYDKLNGKGVSSIDEALLEMELIPLHNKIQSFVSIKNLEIIKNYFTAKPVNRKPKQKIKFPKEILPDLNTLCEEFSKYSDNKVDCETVYDNFKNSIEETHYFFSTWIKYTKRKNVSKWMKNLDSEFPVNSKIELNAEFSIYLFVQSLRHFLINKNRNKILIDEFERLILSKPLKIILEENSAENKTVDKSQLSATLLYFYYYQKINKKRNSTEDKNEQKLSEENVLEFSQSLVTMLLGEKVIRNYLQVNEFGGITYFNKEKFDEFVNWLALLISIDLNSLLMNNDDASWRRKTLKEKESHIFTIIRKNTEWLLNLKTLAVDSGFDFNIFLSELNTKQKEENKKEVD